MNRTNQILAGLLVVQLALVALSFRDGDTHSISKPEALLEGFEKDQVTEIVVLGEKAEEAEIVLAKRDEGWVLASHFDYPALESKVSAALSALAGAESRRAIASGDGREEQLAVSDESFKRQVTLRQGESEQRLFIGNPAGRGKTAVRVAGSDEVHAQAGLSPSTFSNDVSRWIETTYFEVDKDKIATASLSNEHGTFELRKDGEAWRVMVGDAPLAIPADKALKTSTIDSLLDAASKVRMIRPVGKEAAQTAATATLVLRGGEESSSQEWTLELFAGGDTVIAHEQGNDFHVEVDKSSLSAILDLSTEKLIGEPEPAPAAAPNPGLPPQLVP